MASVVFNTGLIKLRTFNALEARLPEKRFLHLPHARKDRGSLRSVDCVENALA